MNDLTKEYTLLFNGISAALDNLTALSMQLKSLQCQAEELYISKSDDADISNQHSAE